MREVGRWIDEDGSNFWGVHVDEAEVGGDDTQIVTASSQPDDRETRRRGYA